MMTVVNHWFVRRRSQAMALVMEGFALAGIIVPLLLAWAIGGIDPDVSERYGWRNTARFIGILSIGSAIPLSLLVRNRPEDLGLKPDGDSSVPVTTLLVDSGIPHSEKKDQEYTWQNAIRTKAFWLITLGHAFSSMFLSTVFVHMGLMLDDRGFSVQTIGVVVAIFTAASAIFILVGGYLGDRFSMKMVAFGFSVIQPLSAVALVLAHSMGMLVLFAVLFGVGWGGRTPVMTALRGAYFGRNAFATITGISMVPLNILLFTGPVFAGLMRDATGSFDASFLIIAVITLLGSCLFLALGQPVRLCEPVTGISQAGDN
jgi:MFS family permease